MPQIDSPGTQLALDELKGMSTDDLPYTFGNLTLGLVRLPRYHGNTGRCRSDLSSLKPDRLPTQGAVQCR